MSELPKIAKPRPVKVKKSDAVKHSEFLAMAYCGLVLRGHDNERGIPDPILRYVWRYGKKCLKESKR